MKARLLELDLLNGESTLEKHTHVYVRGVLLKKVILFIIILIWSYPLNKAK